MLNLCLGAREGAPTHQAQQTGLSVELGHCQAEPAGVLGVLRVAVVSGKCPVPLPGPRTQTYLVPQGVKQKTVFSPRPTQSVPQSHSSWVPPETATVPTPDRAETMS